MAERVAVRELGEMDVPDELGNPRRVVAIRYWTSSIPPRTVFVPVEEDSPEARQRAIKEDLEAVRAARATGLEIP